jgi:hypothetical protein
MKKPSRKRVREKEKEKERAQFYSADSHSQAVYVPAGPNKSRRAELSDGDGETVA